LEKHYPDLKYDDFPLIDMTDRAKAYDAIRASIRPIKENAIVV
jgi:hypothetical protein